MRAVLINPAFQRDVEGIAQTTVAPPMGLLYLAAALREAGHEPIILDGNAHGWGTRATVAQAIFERAGLIGITATTPTIDRADAIALGLRAAGYRGPILVGGPHPTALPVQTLQRYAGFDAAAIGEAEVTLVEVMAALRERDDWRGVDGLAVREGRGASLNAQRSPPEDLDALPWPARDLLPAAPYRCPDGERFAVVVASRGCPAPCSYCAVPHIFGRRLRRRDPDRIADEVEALADQGVTYVHFVDDTFTWNRRWVLQLCDALRARGLHRRLQWQCLTRVDRVTPELLTALAQAGCRRVQMGVEGAHGGGEDALRKGITSGQAQQAFAAARAAGLQTLAFAMINVPGEGHAEIAQTEALLKRLDPDYLQLTICTPFPGTAMYAQAEHDGSLRTRDFADFRFLREVVLDNGVLRDDEVLRAHRRVQRRFWLHPRRMLRLAARMGRSAEGRAAAARMARKALRHLGGV